VQELGKTVALSHTLNYAGRLLLEASNGAYELHMSYLATQLLDLSRETLELSENLIDALYKPPPTPKGRYSRPEPLPFDQTSTNK
jgi:hypothetical protein